MRRFDPPIAKEDFEIEWKDSPENLCPTCSSKLLAWSPENTYEPNKSVEEILTEQVTKLKDDLAKKSTKREEKKECYVQKYEGNEAVLIDGIPYFIEVIDNQVIQHSEIILPDMILKPLPKTSYLSKEYSFKSIEEINEYILKAQFETFDSIYLKVKAIWSKYIDADNDHLTICAADTIFTYFQDKLGMTHYLLFVGDNGTGKSNNLKVFQYLAYRPLFNTSMTVANIYQFLGNIEEGQGIILEDEADRLDQDYKKMEVYKVGYQTGTKVARTDISYGRKQEGYWTYCFKALSAEQQPETKGLMERTFVLQCSTGNPKYDITEAINPAGDSEHEQLFSELHDIRKLLLIFRLVNYNKPIPDIQLNIKNRDKQVCKPLLRLFQNSNSVKEISTTLSKFISEKRDRKTQTLDARLFEIIRKLVNGRGPKLSNHEIWESVKAGLEGSFNPAYPLSYESEEFGSISQKEITGILISKFGAEKRSIGHEGKRGLKFKVETLAKLESNYVKLDKIEIIKNADSADTSFTSKEQIEVKADSADTATSSLFPDKIEKIEHKIDEEYVIQGSKNTDICNNDLKDLSAVSANHSHHRVSPKSDLYYCDYCSFKGDRFFFQNSRCPRSKLE